MRTDQLAAWLVAVTVYVAGTLGSGLAVAADSKTAPDAQKLDNASCQTCHNGEKGKLEMLASNGEKRPVRPVVPVKYATSVHAKMDCVACHLEITDSTTPHKKSTTVKKAECAQCHLDLWEETKKLGKTAEKPRLGIVADNVAAYRKSFHSKPDKDDPTKLMAICSDCHDVHTFDVPPRGTPERKAWHLTVPNVCGEKCHTDHLEEWSESIHGKEVIEKKNDKSAVCSDCHTTHDIIGSSTEKAKLAITASCGDCHKAALKSYKASYHGQVNTLGYAYTAKCFDCHGSHGIQPSKDPKSKMHEKNRLKTCQKCHSGKEGKPPLATAGFLSFSPHGNSHDFAKYPEIWLTTKAMGALLVGVFAFFWLHSGLWWYREYADRKAGNTRWRIRTSDIPAEQLPFGERRSDLAKKHVRRFGPVWRIAHLLFALSVMTLVLTGMAAFFPETGWAKTVMAAFGSPRIAGQVHRLAAYTMLGIFAIHLVAVSVTILRKWKDFKFFGPDSFVPNWKDLEDIIGMFKWFVGEGPRPRIERWSYWEKYDYWAVFWGMAIIGGSGMMLAFPHVVATYLPGWVFNVAMVVHGEEAVLAAVFLFTVHFFNNHFRPDKLPPPDVVMFTGTQSLDEFRHEHRAQYDRLVASGELEKYLVDAPSAPFTLASKILGLVLIAFGLTLLVLIAIGFLGGGH
ncbi:MAG: cytochrome C [Betaproteobacteria bacterium]|nr:cytochrome C [Betaproteobacteria bacterium]